MKTYICQVMDMGSIMTGKINFWPETEKETTPTKLKYIWGLEKLKWSRGNKIIKIMSTRWIIFTVYKYQVNFLFKNRPMLKNGKNIVIVDTCFNFFLIFTFYNVCISIAEDPPVCSVQIKIWFNIKKCRKEMDQFNHC